MYVWDIYEIYIFNVFIWNFFLSNTSLYFSWNENLVFPNILHSYTYCPISLSTRKLILIWKPPLPIFISSLRQIYGTSNSLWFHPITHLAPNSLSTRKALISVSKLSLNSSLVWKEDIILRSFYNEETLSFYGIKLK